MSQDDKDKELETEEIETLDEEKIPEEEISPEEESFSQADVGLGYKGRGINFNNLQNNDNGYGKNSRFNNTLNKINKQKEAKNIENANGIKKAENKAEKALDTAKKVAQAINNNKHNNEDNQEVEQNEDERTSLLKKINPLQSVKDLLSGKVKGRAKLKLLARLLIKLLPFLIPILIIVLILIIALFIIISYGGTGEIAKSTGSGIYAESCSNVNIVVSGSSGSAGNYSLNTEGQQQVSEILMNEYGLNKAATAGLIAVLMHESGPNINPYSYTGHADATWEQHNGINVDEGQGVAGFTHNYQNVIDYCSENNLGNPNSSDIREARRAQLKAWMDIYIQVKKNYNDIIHNTSDTLESARVVAAQGGVANITGDDFRIHLGQTEEDCANALRKFVSDNGGRHSWILDVGPENLVSERADDAEAIYNSFGSSSSSTSSSSSSSTSTSITSMSTNDYIASMIDGILTDEQKQNKELIKALAIVIRTNLYANTNKIENKTCTTNVTIPSFTKTSNRTILDEVANTGNKVFTLDKNKISKVEYVDRFTYISIDKAANINYYKLTQGGEKIDETWVKAHATDDKIIQSTYPTIAFNIYGAFYNITTNNMNYSDVLYKYLGQGKKDNCIFEVGKSLSELAAGCGSISLTKTSLTRQQFVDACNNQNQDKEYRKNFFSHCGEIYDISIDMGFNPEIVVIKAIQEGFSPANMYPERNNYWGYAMPNGAQDGKQFASLADGVKTFITTWQNYRVETLFDVFNVKHYSWIGNNWYNPGSSGVGGCYMYPYLTQWMTPDRIKEVAPHCGDSAPSCIHGSESSDCLPTIAEDQAAYSSYLESQLGKIRKSVFGIDIEACTNKPLSDSSDIAKLGKEITDTAVATFDSYGYCRGDGKDSYPCGTRMDDDMVDCSSMVSRAYALKGINYFISNNYAYTTSSIQNWCDSKNVSSYSFSESDLLPGDVLMYIGSNGIYHVSLYLGDGKQFEARGNSGNFRYDFDSQVAITNYGGADGYCRPLEIYLKEKE